MSKVQAICWFFHRWGKWSEAERHRVTQTRYIETTFETIQTHPNTNEPLTTEVDFVRILQVRKCERCGITKVRTQEAR